MNCIYYRLADVVIKVILDFEYQADKSYMNQFLVNATSEVDYCFEFRHVKNIEPFLKETPNWKAQVEKFHYYQNDKGKEYCFHLKEQYYHAVTIIERKGGMCYYVSQDWLREEIQNGYYLENYFCLEKILMQFGCMILHSCHVQKTGSSILFSAPSGTGKSTQGELWRKYNEAEIVNGDRTAIRKVDGVWKAYGVPFCGTSQIHKNKQAPLKAIVVLRQFPENQVSMITGKEAFFSLYSELTVNNWNRQFVNSAMEWTVELLNEIPVYKFLCTKEAEAVSVLNNYMTQREKQGEVDG